ncbi:ESX-3 secretion system eccC3 domain protein [Mycobacteroides abscessus MAB_082312_2258]|nr:ESX-3 secretion system eccC3 domain protein [Mycobacteroides abscessus MAB_082312_2258]
MIVILIVGMVVALVASGIRLISPQTLFFPFVLLLAATALYRGGGDKVRTEEVDAERADYLRYLSVVRENLRTHATAQRKALEWSHPDPEELTTVPGSRRQWERDPAMTITWWSAPDVTTCRWPARCGSRTSPTRSIWSR